VTNYLRAFAIGCSVIALAACNGANDVVAPGGDINFPTPTPTGTPTPPPSGATVTPAATCTPGTTDGGTIVLQNNRGSVRNCIVTSNGGVLTANLNLTGRRADGIMYSICGRTDVGTDVSLAGGGAPATLTIAPGATVFACAANRETTLVVNRGSRLVADGTSTQPIIFTAQANLTGEVAPGQSLTEATDNLWGGIIVNGRAPVSDCDATVSSSATGGTAGCWRQSEGIVTNRPLYGGDRATDDSGVMEFVQVNFTGVGQNGDEVQGITLNGVGSGTTVSSVQVHNSRDDGIEVFGGRINMNRLIFTGIADDSLDTDVGYQGAVQFVLAVRRANGTVGDSVTAQTLLEVDSSSGAANDNTPRQKLRLANFTFLQTTPNEPAIRIRGGADVELSNGIVVARNTDPRGCLDIDDAQTVQTTGPEEAGPPVLRSVSFDCNVLYSDSAAGPTGNPNPDTDTFEATTLANTLNLAVTQSYTNTLVALTGSTVGLFAPGATELAVTAATLAAPLVQVNYIGAFSGPADTWSVGWTCNSDVANLRGANNCTDIRVS